MLTMVLQRFEPVGWAEELLPRATAADLPELPQLYTAASVCALTGRPDAAVADAQRPRPRSRSALHPFEDGWSLAWEAIGHRYAGRIDRWLEICDVLTAQGGLARTIGLIFSIAVLPGLGRSEEARAIADDAVEAARELKNPFWIAFALEAYARAYADKDPGLAMDTMDEVLDYTREHRLLFFEANALREIAALEAVLGDPEQALELFDTAVASYHRAGNHGSVATTLAQVAGAVQPPRPARDRRHHLRHQHPPRHQPDRQPPRGRGAPARRCSATTTSSAGRRPGRRWSSTRRWSTSAARSPWPGVSSPGSPDAEPPSGGGTTPRTPRPAAGAPDRRTDPSPGAADRG